ncbi:hypothetical protein AM228_09670 [Planktothricoides sp. SR001]|uniref:hypothetical protein n=1 Tax=Planktothricoides sp. SR001 TaxID=1705388 RepID=UPI0006BF3C65|nr:hypothetical protein [Planktothricoides sp. SR001]KOR37040.1 hypothetical protein AM228_09670 [Planktothricoides sp. SR001]
MEKIPSWIIPIPLDDRCKFSVRVLTSWISLTLALGLIIFIAGIPGGAASGTNLTDSLLGLFVAFPILICLFGVIGIVFSSTRGEEPYYPGWYWYLFPFVIWITVSWLMFGFFIGLIGLLIGAPGVKLPDLPKPSGRPSKDTIRRELNNMKVEDLLKDFEKDLEQLEQMDQQNKLNPKQKDVVRKLRQFDRSKYDQRLRDMFEEDELEELILLILIFLGVEIR